jgi:hypothetical protein
MLWWVYRFVEKYYIIFGYFVNHLLKQSPQLLILILRTEAEGITNPNIRKIKF